jgi:hypothetical protein
MMAPIRLDLVLREAVDTPYANLVTRSTGAAVRHRLLATLRDRPLADARLDFTEVGFMDFSCADEVVAKLLLEVVALPVGRILLVGLREDHAEAIDQALDRHGLVLAACTADTRRTCLLGRVADDWTPVFERLQALGRAGVAPIAAELQWPEARAGLALGELADRRCVIAHPDDTFELGLA